MKRYIIVYTLRAERHDYSKWYQTIKSFGEWVHPHEAAWIVKTEKTASEMVEALMEVRCIDNGNVDTFDIIELGDDYDCYQGRNIINFMYNPKNTVNGNEQ